MHEWKGLEEVGVGGRDGRNWGLFNTFPNLGINVRGLVHLVTGNISNPIKFGN